MPNIEIECNMRKGWFLKTYSCFFFGDLKRYEDLLFDSERVVRTICKCVGGTPKGSTFQQLDTSAKSDHAGFNNVDDVRQASLRKYSNEAKRWGQYTAADIRFMKDVFDPDLLAYFRYPLEKMGKEKEKK